ncbi:hypothetical protein FB451DRAFT_1254254 [Mycena latifolia]|nr:hypothetical protein FB451DRAFT_1254254 [Mycena latifolia]
MDDNEPEEYRDDEATQSDVYSDEPATKRRKTAKGKSTTARASPKPKDRRSTTSSKGKNPPKGKGRIRGAGSLKRMLEMPMDLFYEICCHLEPAKLLLFARTNKKLRAILMARRSTSIWRAARQNVSAPDPPSCMAEPAWTNLLYTPNGICFECDTKTNYIDFALRRRLCLECRKKHLLRIKPHESVSGYGFDPKLFDLVPYTKRGGSFSGWSATTYKSFWRPDLQGLKIKVAQFQLNIKAGAPTARKEYEDFVKTRSLESATELEAWADNEKEMKANTDESRRNERYDDIVDRLVRAGYRRDEITKDSFHGQNGVVGVRRLTDTEWEKIGPKLMGQLDAARMKRVKARRMFPIKIAYTAFLRSLAPIQKFFVPREPFPSLQFMSSTPQIPTLLCIQQLLDMDPSVERMNAIAEAASLSMPLPPSVAWVTLNTPPAERDTHLAELGKIFDLATAVFIVDTWWSGSSIQHNWDHNWKDHWPSLGPAPKLVDQNELFIGRDAMNLEHQLVFSSRGAEAVRAVLALEHLDAASATATELDTRNSLFKCTHCSTPEKDFVYTWRGCAVHLINEKGHTQSWSLVPATEAASYAGDRFPSPMRLSLLKKIRISFTSQLSRNVPRGCYPCLELRE